MKPPRPENETARLAALHRYRVLDTDPEEVFDNIVGLASLICRTPIALITFIDSDRQWVKSKIGLDISELSRDLSFCAHAILRSDCFIVEDALADERFFNNPLVASPPHLRFYAAIPLTSRKGHGLGTLCVADYAPRSLSDRETAGLRGLAHQVLSHLESKRRIADLKQNIAKQKRIEKALRESRERLHLVTRAINDVIWEWNLVTNRFWWNEAVQERFGYAAGEIEPTAAWWQARIHPEDKERVLSGIQELIARKGKVWSSEYRFARSNGAYADILESGHLTLDRKGEPVRMIGAMTDITQKRNVEEALKKSEKRFRAIFDQAAIGIVCVNGDREIIEGNEALQTMLGYGGEEIAHKKFDVFTHPDDIKIDVALFEELFRGRKNSYQIVKRCIHKNGAVLWARKIVSLVRSPDGEAPFAMVMVEDITDQKRIESELISAYETLQAVINASPLALVIIDRAGIVRNWNPAATKIFGWEEAEVLGHPLPIIPEQKRDEFSMLSRQVLQGKTFSGFETVRQKKGGVLIEVSISTALLHDAKGNIKGIVALFEEISERKKRETMIKEMNEALQQKNVRIAELSEAKNRFFSYISHELKSPLNSIVGFASLLLDRKHGLLNDLQSGWLKRVLGNAKDLARLINNILELARMESGKMSVRPLEVDLPELTESIATNFRPFFEEKGLSLEVKIDSGFPKIVLTDPGHFRSLLSNLLSNALKFTEKGGARIELQRPGKRGLRLKVFDTGTGIPPETLAKLFKEYEHSTYIKETSTAYMGGTGLGLAIVQKIVTALGGTIDVVSALNEGTTFTIELPCDGTDRSSVPSDLSENG